MSEFRFNRKHMMRQVSFRLKTIHLLCLVLLTNSMTVFADSTPAASATEKEEKIDYKLSLSDYSTQSIHANDINLRVVSENQRGWIGYYSESTSNFE